MREPIIDHPVTTYEPVTLAEAYNDDSLDGWTVGTSNPVHGKTLWPTWYATEEAARAAIIAQLAEAHGAEADDFPDFAPADGSPEAYAEAQARYDDWLADQQPTRCATPSEARAEYARNAGSDSPGEAWILTPWDTWEPNPAYRGPKVRHPEDYDFEDDEPQAPAGWTVADTSTPDDDGIPF